MDFSKKQLHIVHKRHILNANIQIGRMQKMRRITTKKARVNKLMSGKTDLTIEH